MPPNLSHNVQAIYSVSKINGSAHTHIIPRQNIHNVCAPNLYFLFDLFWYIYRVCLLHKNTDYSLSSFCIVRCPSPCCYLKNKMIYFSKNKQKHNSIKLCPSSKEKCACISKHWQNNFFFSLSSLKISLNDAAVAKGNFRSV